MNRKMWKMIAAALSVCIALCGAALAEESAPAQTERLSVTTGLPTNKEYTPYLVQVDNAGGARPQKGLAQADVIYECEIQNGGITRYSLLFNDDIPEVVEPVRSARIMHADIALDWNATFIHFGGQQMSGTNVYSYMSGNGVTHLDGISVGNPLFYRDGERTAPHNVICKLKALSEDAEYARTAEAKSPLTFDAENYTQKGEKVSSFEITYKTGYTPAYSYNEEDGLYYRFYEREPQLDANTGEQVTVSNVIIMYADYTYYNWEGDRPVVELTGKNYCKFFIDGNYFEGYWSRNSTDDTTYFRDYEGQEVIFKPGKTAIQVLREDKEITMY